MKKSAKYLLLLLAAIIVFEIGNYAYGMIHIAAGYNAKTMCSCVYVSKRSSESVLEQDIAVGAASFIKTTVDTVEKSATASFLGLSRKALFREGIGCTLLSEISAEQLLSQNRAQVTYIANPKADSLQWPYGNLDTLSISPSIDINQINAAFDYAFDEPHKDNPRYTRAALVVHKGKIIKEQYAEGFDADTPLLGWSMTKSVTNALVGLRVKDGSLTIDAPAEVPAWQKEGDPRAAIRLADLMHMTSGLDFLEDYSSPSDVNKMLWTKASASKIAASARLGSPINTNWYYSSGTTNIISEIIRSTFNDDRAYHLYPYERLFHPLGMSSAIIEPDASGTFVGSSFMYATARDWAKFGLLYLHDGIWNGERILPEGWVDYSRTRTPVLEAGFYSAQFWNNAHYEPEGTTMPRHWPNVPEDAYYASGFEGQQVVIIPSLEMVIVRLGCTSDRANWDIGHFVSMVVKGIIQ